MYQFKANVKQTIQILATHYTHGKKSHVNFNYLLCIWLKVNLKYIYFLNFCIEYRIFKLTARLFFWRCPVGENSPNFLS